MRRDRGFAIIIVILILVIVIGYFWFDSRLNQDRAVAVINGEKISEKEFLDLLKSSYGREVLEDLINKRVINEAAKSYGITADQKEIDRQYNEFMRDYETEEQFMIHLETEMGWTKEGLLSFIEYYTLWEEIATKDIVVTDNQVADYYEKNKANYTVPENFHIQQIVVRTKEEANQIINELNNGSNFNTLAKERSIDFLSISTGGDLGKIYVNDPSIDPEIIKKAKTMKIDDLSIIQLGDFYAVIKVLAHNKAVQYTLEEVKSEIRREIALRQANPLPLVLEQLKKDMDVRILDKTLLSN